MEIKYRLYPYPVLWNKNDDYKKPSKFSVEIEAKENFRELISTRETEINYDLKDNDILGRLQISFFVLAKEDILDYKNSSFNEDYSGESFHLKKGSIIAIADGYRFDIEKNDDNLEKVSSIFSICQKETVEQTGMTVDMNSDKIRIALNKTDYINYHQLSQNSNNINIINSIIILPALIFIFEQLKKDFDENDFADYKWFRALEKIFEKNKQNLNKELLENQLSIDLAQRILNYPIERAFNSLKDENDGDDEE